MNKQSLLYMAPIETFYDTKKEVIENNIKGHLEVFEEDRELYTYLLYFNNAKYYSKELIISNLLKNSLYKEETINKEAIEIEDFLIQKALLNENITHALKMLLDFKESKINNNRASKIILKFLFSRGNLDYICIKYKTKVKDLLIHSLGLPKITKILNGDKKLFDKYIGIYKNPYAYQCLMFVFNKEYVYTSDYLKAYLEAKKIISGGDSFSKIKKGVVPIEVLEGFIHDSHRYISIEDLYETSNVSAKQVIQKQKVLTNNGVKEIKIDYSKLDSLDLIKLLYNGNLSKEEEDNLYKELYIKISKVDTFISNLKDTAIVFDFSLSLEGSEKNKYNAFYKEMELYFSVRNNYRDNLFMVGGQVKDNLIYPAGDSNISMEVLNAIKKGFKNVLIISDGFENIGNLDDIYSRLMELECKVNILHLNPVFSAKDMDFKVFSSNFITVPFDKISDLDYLELFSLLENSPEEFKRIMKSKIVSEINTL